MPVPAPILDSTEKSRLRDHRIVVMETHISQRRLERFGGDPMRLESVIVMENSRRTDKIPQLGFT
jgi:hypothetical protein